MTSRHEDSTIRDAGHVSSSSKLKSVSLVDAAAASTLAALADSPPGSHATACDATATNGSKERSVSRMSSLSLATTAASSLSASSGASDQRGAGAKQATQRLLKGPEKRYIPSNKKEGCAVTFPEKLMSMLDYAEDMKAKCQDPDSFCMAWLPAGKSFIVRDPSACADTIIPLFFKQAKFSSFTRKLYRCVL